MSEKILSDLIEQSIKNLKQAQDVPRLFRKTNRSFTFEQLFKFFYLLICKSRKI